MGFNPWQASLISITLFLKPQLRVRNGLPARSACSEALRPHSRAISRELIHPAASFAPIGLKKWKGAFFAANTLITPISSNPLPRNKDREEIPEQTKQSAEPRDGGGFASVLKPMASASGTKDPPISRTAKRPRYDTSLCFLTQRVCMVLRDSCSRVIDLNALAKTLKVPKRRLYDVTNVLEGISLARKKSKNHIEWLGNKSDILSHEMNILIQTERKLDELINSCTGQLHQMSHNTYTQRFAYLTYEDVQRIPNLKEQTVIVIKAPPGTKLEVPHPVESLQVHLASTKGPIEAFLCTDEPFPNDTTRACVLNGSSSGPFGPLQQSPSAASSTAPPVSSFHPTGDR